MQPVNRKTLTELCEGLYQEDPEHMEGGCGDFSTAIFLWIKEKDPEADVRIVAGHAWTEGIGKHTHVWLEISGKRFDPVAAGTKWQYSRYELATPDTQQKIIELHTDDTLENNWEESYERDLILSIANQPPPTHHEIL